MLVSGSVGRINMRSCDKSRTSYQTFWTFWEWFWHVFTWNANDVPRCLRTAERQRKGLGPPRYLLACEGHPKVWAAGTGSVWGRFLLLLDFFIWHQTSWDILTATFMGGLYTGSWGVGFPWKHAGFCDSWGRWSNLTLHILLETVGSSTKVSVHFSHADVCRRFVFCSYHTFCIFYQDMGSTFGKEYHLLFFANWLCLDNFHLAHSLRIAKLLRFPVVVSIMNTLVVYVPNTTLPSHSCLVFSSFDCKSDGSINQYSLAVLNEGSSIQTIYPIGRWWMDINPSWTHVFLMVLIYIIVCIHDTYCN